MKLGDQEAAARRNHSRLDERRINAINERIETMNKSFPILFFERLVLGCMDSYDSGSRRI
jgi:hypothetical protein